MLVFGVVLTAGILFSAVNLISDLSGVRSGDVGVGDRIEKGSRLHPNS
jgi:hypothetical protein